MGLGTEGNGSGRGGPVFDRARPTPQASRRYFAVDITVPGAALVQYTLVESTAM